MASIFTYDPDPPRISSPWLNAEESNPPSPSPSGSKARWRATGRRALLDTPPPELLADYNVTKLEPEPQTTATEYKLHLLLRPRRVYSSSTTGTHIAGSQQSKSHARTSSPLPTTAPVPAASTQSRQHRLQQLTTQLLWRLQQSSPYHASSTSDLVVPRLPDASEDLDNSPRLGKLLPGLAESRGALYEIGVSDDGTFVGLTEDEMKESLATLRAMAASLGCVVEVTRLVLVGECEWVEDESAMDLFATETQAKRQQAQLWVAEALVTPHVSHETNGNFEGFPGHVNHPSALHSGAEAQSSLAESTTEQLRVTLTGPTTSGKSSLLGTLTTGTLDNGRGKSRLSLLKHRHEIESGVTSSVAQEIMGYATPSEPQVAAQVINYATGNVTSWTDVHACAQGGRVVFMSDSAGHPRYRRTTVRGLVGWAPHWTMLCIAADEGENAPSGVGGTSSAREILGVAGAGIDLAGAHLELCLKLDKPLAIVITKLDLASKSNLRHTLAKILTAVKNAGKVPAILPPDQSKNVLGLDLETITQAVELVVMKTVDTIRAAATLSAVVPIIMTSAAKGTGIRMLHALLRDLPIPPKPSSQDFVGAALNPEQPSCLFHIEDLYGVPAAFSKAAIGADSGFVVGGHLRFGTLSVGDRVVVGPFPADAVDSPVLDRRETRTPPSKATFYNSPKFEYGSLSRSAPSTPDLTRTASRNNLPAAAAVGEWHDARIVSIRNLRLPVATLEAGQVGTLGIVLDWKPNGTNVIVQALQAPRIRKGMVVAIPSQHMLQTGHSLQAASGFSAAFDDGDINSITPGSLVVIYIASIRASARVLKLQPHIQINDASNGNLDDTEDFFGLEEKDEPGDSPVFGKDGTTDVTFELLNNREWIELGSQVLIMPGGGTGLYSGTERGEKGIAGLEGFVGKVVEVVE
jgi:GTPase